MLSKIENDSGYLLSRNVARIIGLLVTLYVEHLAFTSLRYGHPPPVQCSLVIKIMDTWRMVTHCVLHRVFVLML
jgi:hypothetical protein